MMSPDAIVLFVLWVVEHERILVCERDASGSTVQYDDLQPLAFLQLR